MRIGVRGSGMAAQGLPLCGVHKTRLTVVQ
jgi:hypothetical protein